jgi:hypothetical protein
MSNYINNLIARTQHTAEVVRPRLPSLFEPPLVAARAELYEIDEAIDPVAPLAIQPPLDEEAKPGSPPARQIEVNRVRKKFIAPQTEAEIAHNAPLTNAPSTSAELPDWRGIQLLSQPPDVASISSPPLTGHSMTQPVSTVRSPERTANQNRQETDSHSLIDEPQDERPPGVIEEKQVSHRSPGPAAPPHLVAVAGPSRLPPALQAKDNPPAASPPDPPLRRPAHERVAHQGLEEAQKQGSPIESNATRIVVQPRLSRREEDQATVAGYHSGQGRLDLHSHEPPPMPTINVTIGRIEVKALPPPVTRSRPQKNAGQLMSLDEYMRRRKHGGDSI